MVPLGCIFVVLRSRATVMSFRVAGEPVLDRDGVLARVQRAGVRGAFSIWSRAQAGAADAGHCEANKPQQCDRARGSAEEKAELRLPREMHFFREQTKRFGISAGGPTIGGTAKH